MEGAPGASNAGPQRAEERLREVLPGWIETSTAQRLLREAAGDPEVVAEAVRRTWYRGDLHHDDGMWWLSPIDGSGTPIDVGARLPMHDDVRSAAEQMRGLCDAGRPDEALAISADLVPSILVQVGVDAARDRAMGELAIATIFALLEAGRVHAAEPAAQSAHAEAVRRHAPQGQGWFAMAWGATELLSGRIVDARRPMAEARLLGRLTGDGPLIDLATGTLSLTYAMVDEPEPVFVGPKLDRGSGRDASVVAELRARSQAWSRENPGWHAAVVEAARAERSAGRYGRAATLAAELALFGDASEACRLFERFGPLDGDLLPLYPEMAAALDDRDADRLEALSGRLEQLGVLGLSSALTLHAVGTVLDADPERGRELLKEANRRSLGVQHGTRYLAHFRRLLPLRDREREIVSLAARGRSNRQIADELVLSIRTVENHLYRAYQRLGVESRDEVVDLFSALPADP